MVRFIPGIVLQWESMKTCVACALTLDEGQFPPRSRQCRPCKTLAARAYRQTEAYRQVKARYRASEKGRATERAREERPDVLEQRRIASSSPQGRINKAKYEATEKGKATRAKAIAKYTASARGKAVQRKRDALRKLNQDWVRQKRAADRRYRQTEGGKAVHAAVTHRRRAAIAGCTDAPLTSAEWLAILKANHYRCYYCKEKTKLSMDHVIPLSKGGEHRKENVVPACIPCNSRKNNRLTMLL